MKKTAFCMLAVVCLLGAYPAWAQRTRPVLDDAATLAELLHKDYSSIEDPSVRSELIRKDRRTVLKIFSNYLDTTLSIEKNITISNILDSIIIQSDSKTIRLINKTENVNQVYTENDKLKNEINFYEQKKAESNLYITQYNLEKKKMNQDLLNIEIKIQEVDQWYNIENNTSRDSVLRFIKRNNLPISISDTASKDTLIIMVKQLLSNQSKYIKSSMKNISDKIDSETGVVSISNIAVDKIKDKITKNNDSIKKDLIDDKLTKTIRKLFNNIFDSEYEKSGYYEYLTEMNKLNKTIIDLSRMLSSYKLGISAGVEKNVTVLFEIERLKSSLDEVVEMVYYSSDNIRFIQLKKFTKDKNNLLHQQLDQFYKKYLNLAKLETDGQTSSTGFAIASTQKSALAAGASGTLKLLVDALSQEIVERIQTELALTVMAEVSRALDPDKAANPRARTTLQAIGVLLPQTLHFLRTPQQPQSPETLLQALREKVSIDVRDLPLNVGQLHTVPAIRTAIDNPRIALLYEGVRTLITMSKCTQPYQWLDALADIRPGRWANVSTGMEDAMALLQAVAFVSNSLLVSENGELVYAKSAYVKTILAHEDSRNLFLGLAYETLRNGENYPELKNFTSTQFVKLNQIAKATNITQVKSEIDAIIAIYKACAQGVDELNDLANQLAERRRAGQPIDPATAVQYYRSLIDWADTLYHNLAVPGNLPQHYYATNEVSRFFTGARLLGAIYQEVMEKKYIAAANSSLDFVINVSNEVKINNSRKTIPLIQKGESILNEIDKVKIDSTILADQVREWKDRKSYNFVRIAFSSRETINTFDEVYEIVGKFNEVRRINKILIKIDTNKISTNDRHTCARIINLTDSLHRVILKMMSSLLSPLDPSKLDEIRKYLMFVASVVEAEDAKEMRAALRTVAEPVGSSTIKKESKSYLYIGAYPQLFGGSERVEFSKIDKGAAGFSVPFGVGFSQLIIPNSATKPNSALTIFVSVLDLAAPVSWRFDNTNDTELPDFEIIQLVSPGLFLFWDLPRFPLSIGGGVSYRPQLRRFVEGGNETQQGALRYSVGIAMDLPLFRLSRTPR